MMVSGRESVEEETESAQVLPAAVPCLAYGAVFAGSGKAVKRSLPREEDCFLAGCSGLGFLTLLLLLLPPPSGADRGMAEAAAASCLGVILVVEEGGDGKGERREVGGGLLGRGLLRGSRGETALSGRARWSYIAESEKRGRLYIYIYK